MLSLESSKDFDEEELREETKKREPFADLETARIGDGILINEGDASNIHIGNELATQAYEEILLKMAGKDNIMKKTNLSWMIPMLDLLWYPLTAFAFYSNVPAWAVGIIWGVAQFRAGLFMHMGIHKAIFNGDAKNNWFGGIFVQNILIGISWRWWR